MAKSSKTTEEIVPNEENVTVTTNPSDELENESQNLGETIQSDEKSLEKVIDNPNTVTGKVQLVVKRFVKCGVDEIKHEGKTYKRGDEISMTAEMFAKLSKCGHKFED